MNTRKPAASRRPAPTARTAVATRAERPAPAVEPAAVKALRRVMARKAQGRAGIQAVVCAPGEGQAQVLGAQPAGAGRIYEVLAPTAQPRHLSTDDIEALVRQMVAGK
jgi:hypothetical protein